MTVAPDLDGFAAAQRRHRAQAGEPVTFLADPVVTFPPGTAIDPDTGEPFDPTIAATASAQASASAICSISYRPLLLHSDASPTEAGVDERNHPLVIADPEWHQPLASATSFVLRGHEYKIRAMRLDAPVRGGDRLLIWGRGVG